MCLGFYMCFHICTHIYKSDTHADLNTEGVRGADFLQS